MTVLWRSFGAALLALALVAVQALGLAHRVAHGPLHSAKAEAHAGVHAGVHATGSEAHAHGEPTSLFGAHEEGGVECRLFDQAVHADALKAAAWQAWPPRVPAPMVACAPASGAGARAHAYFARGPPAAHRAGSRAA
ncbi:MAG: hypothetical protein JNN03_09020 [Rubrivivax sp.]|nr:hypothetical protein [Rubrivivax sp.]